ncbi:MAG: hypothetical protein ACOYO1_01760 [Bacteroidales bacterium]
MGNLKKIIFGLYLVFIVNNSFSQVDSLNRINKYGIGQFKIDSSLKKIDFSKFNKVIDSSMYFSEDENDIGNGKYIYLSKKEYIVIWSQNDWITEIWTNSSIYSTDDGIKVGISFELLFNILKNKYQIEDDFGELMLFDKRNHIRIWISNSKSNTFNDKEMNDLYHNILSINKIKLSKMKVKKIDLINLTD